jgi:hypothetical protein
MPAATECRRLGAFGRTWRRGRPERLAAKELVDGRRDGARRVGQQQGPDVDSPVGCGREQCARRRRRAPPQVQQPRIGLGAARDVQQRVLLWIDTCSALADRQTEGRTGTQTDGQTTGRVDGALGKR